MRLNFYVLATIAVFANAIQLESNTAVDVAGESGEVVNKIVKFCHNAQKCKRKNNIHHVHPLVKSYYHYPGVPGFTEFDGKASHPSYHPEAATGPHPHPHPHNP